MCGLVSSLDIENDVLSIIFVSIWESMSKNSIPEASGNFGKSSAGSPISLNTDLPLVIFTKSPSTFRHMGPSGRVLTIS